MPKEWVERLGLTVGGLLPVGVSELDIAREMVSATKYGQIKQDVDKIKAQGEQQLIDEISRLAEEARAQ